MPYMYVTKTVARAMPATSVENGQRDQVNILSLNLIQNILQSLDT